MAYCSPKGLDNKKVHHTCFSKKALVNLANAWNKTNPGSKIANVSKSTVQKLWSELNQKMAGACGKDAEHCWVDKLLPHNEEVNDNLLPKRPKEWEKNKRQWLTNFDIDGVMEQYQDEPKYKFRYLGTFPIDFAKVQDTFGRCLYDEMCTINLKKLYNQGVRILSATFNTDPSYKSGQHWISLVIIIDPSLPSYGAYFSDSVGKYPPREVSEFMERIKNQAKIAFPNAKREFRIDYSKKQMQFKNTECGIFSIAYQIRWINHIHTKPTTTTFEDIIKQSNAINDDIIYELRNVLYRP